MGRRPPPPEPIRKKDFSPFQRALLPEKHRDTINESRNGVGLVIKLVFRIVVVFYLIVFGIFIWTLWTG